MSDIDEKNDTKESSFSSDVVLLSLLISGSTLGAIAGYNRYLKQVTKATDIPNYMFRKRWMYGKVTAVGDGDNFHLFHTPGGIFGGWGWLRKVPKLPKSDSNGLIVSRKKTSNFYSGLKNSYHKFTGSYRYSSEYFLDLKVPYKNLRNLPTVPIRLCAIDAPERAHFGNTSQPYGDEALIWLRNRLLGKYVWVKPLSVDQYNRCVSKVVCWNWLGWQNISLQMVRQGLAVVYEGKTSAEFDREEFLYRFYERRSKAKKRGLWRQRVIETPGEYKKKIKK
ncbi:hypothetical protein Kpol_1002p63 [Vanderwaltozyma polyspora DSM 70294]|uniref:Probable endonuclease LCL3 n=1 Tax=Vanderwaltozyma polyspora (strain ATCC 22028 / DSM 70294 / BCRC 21397 / CBS 2163 / NBRC 10782 / NRRL Y-8283 / UCD 57-17) TaxID=436907 RepID=LCL3_VANPO|nr:uncharacterized protein Kpol_1002p63 [Vanderwaltozyma polyspora DSM 70294]A7TE94.1 RecName: Full=Probable endonuclease LCL3 [Vanderwaltozyma polyspora DSM 70294]EDO19416.1 hypothetical protein Kpol_1002p63 [Vanderwaltozyma polyspora DSM 70294]